MAGFANLTTACRRAPRHRSRGRYSDNKQSAHQATDGLLVGGFNDFPVFEPSEEVFTYSVAPRLELSDNASDPMRVASGFPPGGLNILVQGAAGRPGELWIRTR